MVGIGTIVNVLAIIVGSLTGLTVKKGIPQKLKDAIMQALGLAVIIVGLSGTLQGIYVVTENGKLFRDHIMLMIISLVIGTVFGELLNLELKLEHLALFTQKHLKSKESTFVQGFVSATILYCVGAMAIIGSLEDGLFGNHSTLFAKSILDGISAIVLSATLGAGVLFSAFSVGLYQGLLTGLAVFIKPWLDDIVITQVSLVGSILIFAIGLNMLGIVKFKLANMLPSILIPFVYRIILSMFN